ncbi:permease, partial [Enterococcus faecalis]
VFGPMVDIKNLLMMKRYFKMSFIVQFVLIVALVVTIYAAVV